MYHQPVFKMSVHKDSNDSIFFHVVWRRSVFFSFLKINILSFSFTISSPVPNGRLQFFLFIYSISSVHAHLLLFFFLSLHLFLLLSSSYCMSLSTPVVSDVYRSLCMCECVSYMSCPCLFYFFLYSVFFFLLMGAVKIGL